MICDVCSMAGDRNKLSALALVESDRVELYSDAVALHTSCEDNGCMCQHRVGSQHTLTTA